MAVLNADISPPRHQGTTALLWARTSKDHTRTVPWTGGHKPPSRCTCVGQDVSPPLSWSDQPAGTKSFALISDDPDAPVGTWVHWVLWNIPASARALDESQ